MRTKSILLNLLSITLGAQVSPVPLSEIKDVIPAFDSSGTTTLPAADLNLDIVYLDGTKERSELTVVYDPKSGHYLWHHPSTGPYNPDHMYLNVLKMVVLQIAQMKQAECFMFLLKAPVDGHCRTLTRPAIA